MSFKKISAEDFALAPFREIGGNWAVLTGCADFGFNSMTVSWGALGVLWGRPCAIVFVRPQRYTHNFMEKGGSFSLSLMPEGYHEKMAVFGSRSGRDTDKYAESGFTVQTENGTAYCAQAQKVIICKKIAENDITRDWFCNKDDDDKIYPAQDRHTVYIGEITSILERE